ncbi:tryptophan synthase subunit alpha [Streptomyces sp. NPDC047049]|uniref:tryptophan synthase subunit alpha n=1 Tax=Streptomyces sp. NPDC047049 TaxID=3156688 RepID=UPI0033E14EAE
MATLAADWLTARLLRRSTTDLGVFLPAGFPSAYADAEVLRTFASRGARLFEIGVPYSDPFLDGPVIAEAYKRALSRGTTMVDVLETVRQVATTTWAPVVVVSYWGPVLRYGGPERFAQDLATAGAAGAMIVDLPLEEAGPWLAASHQSGLTTPQLVSRRASDERLARVCSAASGWVYAPAAEAALTGYTGRLDVEALERFTQRLRAAGSVPVVTGIGVSSPGMARSLRDLVDGVVIGTPAIQPLLEMSPSDGLRAAADRVALFAAALQRPADPANLFRPDYIGMM